MKGMKWHTYLQQKTHRCNETWLLLINGKCWNCVNAKWKQTSLNGGRLSLKRHVMDTPFSKMCYNETRRSFYHKSEMRNHKNPKT